MGKNLRTYRIRFNNTDYDCGMDPKPIRANEKTVRAISAQDALIIFKTNEPRFKDQIQGIEDITED